MAASSYDSVWRSQPVSDWNPNDASTGHDFLNQIDTQKGKVSNAENIYQQQENPFQIGSTHHRLWSQNKQEQ